MTPTELWEFWNVLLETTKTKISKDIWDHYIQSGLFPKSLENNVLSIGSTRPYIKNFIETNQMYNDILIKTAQQILGRPLEICITFEETIIQEIEDKDAPSSLNLFSGQEKNKKETHPSFSDEANHLTGPKYEGIPYEPVVINIKGGKASALIEPAMEYAGDTSSIYTTPSPEHFLFPEENDSVSYESVLNSAYTFDTFVPGNSNRVAYSAAQAVAEMPAQKYNPLFIYGQSGLGKTHLMHAIGHYIKKEHPHLRVLCISSERFTNDLINSIKDKKSESFRKKYRNIDVLLVDDIQFLQSKEHTQEEFFHTFNTLHDDKKQIVLTSDTLPKDMKKMEDRLRSRFEGGFVATIQPPDLETRIAILRSISDREIGKNPNLKIPNDVINYIATIFDDNIRSMEGAFTKVIVTAELENKPISKEYTTNILKDIIDDTKNTYLTITSIQDFISSYFKIKKEDLLGKKRTKQLAYCRQIAMYLARELINESYPQIAISFGKKDHTTALHAYEKISKERENNKETRDLIDDIIKNLS